VTVNGPKRGDLEPDLVIDLTASPTSTDLNEVETWRILGRLRGSSILIIDATPDVVVDPVDTYKAVATHQWATPETDVSGLMLVELEAEWPDGHKQSFPTIGYIQVKIGGDLG
jgi:hypothetical protein